MKIIGKPLQFRLIAAAVVVAVVALVSADLFLPSMSPSSNAQNAWPMIMTTDASPNSFVPTATAAVPSTLPHRSFESDAVGGDSRSNNYRLERDSCCFGN